MIIRTLGQIGPAAREALPLLAEISTNRMRFDRWLALLARWRIEQNAATVLPQIQEALRESPTELRLSLISQLPEMGAEALPVLLFVLEQPHAAMRLAAVNAAQSLQQNARPLVPKLEELLRDDPKYGVRRAAQLALRQIAPEQSNRWNSVKLNEQALIH
jgi:HEAT repeat protein